VIEFQAKNLIDTIEILKTAGYEVHKTKGILAGGLVKKDKKGQWHANLTEPVVSKRVIIHRDVYGANNYHKISHINCNLHLNWLNRIKRKYYKDNK